MTNDPAFPQVPVLGFHGPSFPSTIEPSKEGLTIRAYMATAFAATLAGSDLFRKNNEDFQIANRAVKLADELITRLSRP